VELHLAQEIQAASERSLSPVAVSSTAAMTEQLRQDNLQMEVLAVVAVTADTTPAEQESQDLDSQVETELLLEIYQQVAAEQLQSESITDQAAMVEQEPTYLHS
jgi:hypothetical protein